ncbi:MAG: glycosyltransferase family 4 protein [Acidobacteria bacterium]|nr:glycosyltransferase family 4 protein [Acidobacteriota bacterium]
MSLGSPASGSDTSSPWKSADGAKPKPIAVCHIASGDLWAGAERQIATLLKHLARLETLRIVAIVLNPGRLVAEIEAAGIEVKVIPEKECSFLQILGKSVRFLRGREIRVMHSHRYKENLLAALLAWRCGAPFVVRTQHGMPEPFEGIKRIKAALIRHLDRCVASTATHRVISVSHDMREHLTKIFPSERIISIHNGIDLQEVDSRLGPRDAKAALGIPENVCVIGTVGRLEPIKRLDIFLMAARHIVAQLSRVRCLIVGEGSDEGRLREMVHHAGLQDKVLFLGHRNDVYDVMRALDVFVLCSDHEGLPMSLLEAQYLGATVVARSVGGIKEVVQHGRTGLLLETSDPRELAEACLSVLRNESWRRRLASHGSAFVAENFSATQTADSVARLYVSLRLQP